VIKLLWLVALGCIAWRLYAGRWPWQPKLGGRTGAKPSFEAAQARVLLGVEPSASRREIVDAHRRRLAAVHPDRGGSNEQVHEANAARDVLLAQLPGEV
jgi:hypothetical protein